MYNLTQKCKLLKTNSKNWNKTQFGNIFRQMRQVDSKLLEIQSLLIIHPEDESLQSKQDIFLMKRNKLMEYNLEYWKQKSKANYMLLGDTNSRFYHTHATIRRNRNQIKEFVTANSQIISQPSLIAHEITKAFKERFISNSSCHFDMHEDFHLISPIVSSEDNNFLIATVSREEIREAVFDLAPDKSPGPDGFPPFFFQKYWVLVDNSVCRAVQAFFHSGHMLKEINHTFLALIPKIDNPSTSNHFRQISLCTTIYKVISKVLSNRLKVMLGKIIHPLQGAFVPERLIQDNILIAHEVFHSFRNKSGREGWIAIKLDMEKTYDRLEWGYILPTLVKLGFSPVWINWIRSCITSTSFSVLVNGIPGDRFFPSRGIRQGDPLSPYLFILCAEVLARELSQASNCPEKLIGVSLGRSKVRIPFLTFADDTMIFAKATDSSCMKIRQILDKYCSMSGQLVNYHKSAFQCSSNVSDNSKANFASILGMTETQSMGENLGCPIIVSKVTKETFAGVIDKSTAQLAKWKANSLSETGRTVLIQSNLASKASFQMQSFSLPKQILVKLDATYRNFFFGTKLIRPNLPI